MWNGLMPYYKSKTGINSNFLQSFLLFDSHVRLGQIFCANLPTWLRLRTVVNGASEFSILTWHVLFLFIVVRAASKSRIMTRIFCQRLSLGIIFGWMIFWKTYDMKHASPMLRCSREVKVNKPCSRYRLNCRTNSIFTRGPSSSCNSGLTVSRYVANFMP
jgi:hypothetical protein